LDRSGAAGAEERRPFRLETEEEKHAMNSRDRWILASTLLIALVVGTVAPAVADRWEKLGRRTVNDRLDRDEIVVGADEGRFEAIAFKAEGSAVRFHKVVVHFENGETQAFNRNHVVPRGRRSRALDLDGGKRLIEKVVFYYDEATKRRRRAAVELWGRH
jgi:hypothetical protein